MLKKFCILLFFILLSCTKEENIKSINVQEEVKIGRYWNYLWKAHETIESKNLSHIMIIVDMSIHSGKKRMFVIDTRKREIIHKTLTTHGIGRDGIYSEEGNVKFSNIPESHLSSKGQYILDKDRVYSPGYRYKYIMRGIDSTNSNAVIRNVVFHPWNILPTEETYPNSIANSWGCPAVSEEDFEIIHSIIQRENKKVLMWIIDGKENF